MFPEIGVPPNHPFTGISLIPPWLWKAPYKPLSQAIQTMISAHIFQPPETDRTTTAWWASLDSWASHPRQRPPPPEPARSGAQNETSRQDEKGEKHADEYYISSILSKLYLNFILSNLIYTYIHIGNLIWIINIMCVCVSIYMYNYVYIYIHMIKSIHIIYIYIYIYIHTYYIHVDHLWSSATSASSLTIPSGLWHRLVR